MLGGKENACVPNHYLKRYNELYNRPCPRIELHHINEDAKNLVLCALGESSRAFVSQYILTLDQDKKEIRELINRCVVTLNSKKFHDALDEKRKEK